MSPDLICNYDHADSVSSNHWEYNQHHIRHHNVTIPTQQEFTGKVFNPGTGKERHMAVVNAGDPDVADAADAGEEDPIYLLTTWQNLAVGWDNRCHTLEASPGQHSQGVCLLRSQACNMEDFHTPIFTNVTITGMFVSHVALM
jgi:hypothetical protein